MLDTLAQAFSLTFAGTLLAQAIPSAGQALSAPLSPAVLIALCVVAGIGTVLLLPGKREASFRTIGGIILLAVALIFAAILLRWTASDPRGGMGFYFWVFSAIALIGAVRVITHTKPVYSALYFVLTVFASAGLFLLLWAEFMAAALVLIYAGAILVTYVFVIMLAAEATTPADGKLADSPLGGAADCDAISREPIAACAVGFALMCMILFVIFDKYQAIERPANPPIASTVVEKGSTQQLGAFLFSNHLASLELAGLILTIAMVGAIMIARKKVIVSEDALLEMKPEVVSGPATPVDDNPHSIPVMGTTNPRQKAYPQR